jgi:hypothetical protein
MSSRICVQDIEVEEVARQVKRNREWTQFYANFWERGRLDRCGARLATRPGKKHQERDVFGGTPNTAVETTALPTVRISEHLRRLASIRGLMLHFLIFQDQLMQVVDFHDIFRYFSLSANRSGARQPCQKTARIIAPFCTVSVFMNRFLLHSIAPYCTLQNCEQAAGGLEDSVGETPTDAVGLSPLRFDATKTTALPYRSISKKLVKMASLIFQRSARVTATGINVKNNMSHSPMEATSRPCWPMRRGAP